MSERGVFISTVPAERGDLRFARAVALLSLLIFLCIAPFARQQLPEVWAFIPVYESALAINELITAVILLIQFHILRSYAVLVLAAGYLFTVCIIVPHVLTFPGVFAPTGLLGAGPQTTAWLYMFWHGGFPLAVIGYALLKTGNGEVLKRTSSLPVILLTVVAVAAAAAALAGLATAGNALLPALMIDRNYYSSTMIFVVSTVWAFSFIALVTLWFRRPRTVLDLWLMVVMCAWIFDIALSAVLNAGRFDLGFYAGRAYGLLAASFVLLVMLFETGTLYAQLAKMFEAERQERRREAEERRRIFETSLDLILIVNRQGIVLQTSPSVTQILGYGPSEMVGHSASEYVCAEDLNPIRTEMRLARRGHRVRNFPVRYAHKSGRIVTLAWSGVWSEPEQRHFFIGRDITEQQRIERMKNEFIATVSHELRTPVTAINGPLSLLMGGSAGELTEPGKRLVGMAQRNAKRLVRLVDDMLDIEKIEADRMAFEFHRVELKPLIEQAIEANQFLAAEFGVPVRLDRDAPEVAAYSDEFRLMQVLANLLSNAVKFSRKGEEAVVTIEKRGGDRVRITISDHGPGIPEEFKTLIFEKFAQVEATDARMKGGTGLGLSIVKQTMVRLGGSVGHYAAPWGGSVFYIDLPLWTAQPSAPPREAAIDAAVNAA